MSCFLPQGRYLSGPIFFGLFFLATALFPLPSNAAEALLDSASACFDTRRVDDARLLYISLLDTSPDPAVREEALFGLARCDERQDLFAAAAEEYRLYLLIHPSGRRSADATFGRGLSLRRTGRNEEACTLLAAFARANPERPQSSEAALLAAQSALEMHDTLLADTLLSLSVESRPGSRAARDAVVERLALRVLRGEDEQALAVIKRERRRFKNDQVVLLRLSWYEASVALHRGEDALAARMLRALCARNLGEVPEKREILTATLGVLSRIGRSDQAADFFAEHFRSTPPDSLGPAFVAGGMEALRERRRMAEAEAAGVIFLSVWPDDSRAAQCRYRLAEIMALKGDTAAGCSLLVAIVEGSDSIYIAKALQRLGDIAMKNAQLHDAVRWYARSCMAGGDSRARLMLGKALAASGRYEEAAAECESAFRHATGPDEASRAALELARVEELMGRRAIALPWYRRAGENGGPRDVIREARQRFSMLELSLREPDAPVLREAVLRLVRAPKVDRGALLLLARGFAANGDGDAVLDLCRRIVADTATDSIAGAANLSSGGIFRDRFRAAQLRGDNAAAVEALDSAKNRYAAAAAALMSNDRSGVVMWERIMLFPEPSPDSLAVFLQRYPQSSMRGTAHLLLGRISEADTVSGPTEKTMKHYSAALLDADSMVALSALFGLLNCLSRDGRPEAALALLDSLHPGDSRAEIVAERSFLRALVYEKEENWVAAAKLFRTAVEVFPDGPREEEAQYRLACDLHRAGRLSEALECSRSGLALKPAGRLRPAAELELSRILTALNRDAEALAILERLNDATLSPNILADAARDAARLYEHTGQTEKARDACLRAAGFRGGKADAGPLLLRAGKLSLDLHDLDIAMSSYRRAFLGAANGVDSADAALGAATVEVLMGVEVPLREWGKQFSRHSAERYPDLAAELMYQEGSAAMARGRSPDAQRMFISLVDHFPQSPRAPDALYHLGGIAISAGQGGEAMAHFERVAREYPASGAAPLSLFKAGTLWYDSHDFAGAADAFERSARHGRCDELTRRTALFNGAATYQKLSLWTDAARLYGLAIRDEDDPGDNASLLLRRGFCYFQAGRIDEALLDFRNASARARREDRAEAQYWIAGCLAKREEYEKAIAEYLRVPYLYANGMPWGLTAEYEAARLCERSGKTAQAVSLYKRVIAADGENGAFGEKAALRLSQVSSSTTPTR